MTYETVADFSYKTVKKLLSEVTENKCHLNEGTMTKDNIIAGLTNDARLQ